MHAQAHLIPVSVPWAEKMDVQGQIQTLQIHSDCRSRLSPPICLTLQYLLSWVPLDPVLPPLGPSWAGAGAPRAELGTGALFPLFGSF